jgi:hypothetical protein
MDLVDLKRTAADKKAEEERWKGEAVGDGSDYPYGLSVHLDHQTITKLGLVDADFDAGDDVQMVATCIITNDSVNKVNGKTMRSMTVQIQKMALSQDKATDTVGVLYNGK